MWIMTFGTVGNCEVSALSRVMTILTCRYHTVLARGMLVMAVYTSKIFEVSASTGLEQTHNIFMT